MRLREQFFLAGLLWAALLIVPAPAASASDADLDAKADALDRGVTTRTERSAIFTKFGVPNTPPFSTLPPGQALILFSLCGTGTPTAAACQKQALTDRQDHMGWGKVAEDLNKRGLTTDAKVGQAVRRVTDAHRDSLAKAEKLEKVEKMSHIDKPQRIERVERPEKPERPGR